ncbi:hypothetical protein BCT23_15160 [Enterovibrio norvegicus]|uniref:Uncharacterized protein n=1 Tax=Enterovibrio norvegicus TaxID=188144 RepID=A0A2N7LBE8_9GAMM|nr:hypothetical protein BCT23_15160 [Enterovibrio norvegicus]
MNKIAHRDSEGHIALGAGAGAGAGVSAGVAPARWCDTKKLVRYKTISDILRQTKKRQRL